MAKKSSDDVVNEDADAASRFEKLEANVDSIVKHLKIGETVPKDKPAPKEKADGKPAPSVGRTGIPKLLEDIGLLAKSED